jgi:hypothetical protein
MAALANYDDMQSIFHEFGQAYFTSQILDTNESALPGPPAFYTLPDRRFEIERGREITLPAEPFVLERAWLQLRSGTDYRITRTESGNTGRASWENQAQFEFVPIPETLKVLCEAPSIYFLLLTTGQAGDKTVLDLGFEAEEDGLLNCCLVGTWEQTTDQIRPIVEASLGDGLQLTSLEGRFILIFDENHRLQFFPEGYQGTVTLDSENGERLTVTVQGLNVARYDTPEEGLVRVVGEEPNFSVTLGSPDGATSFPLPAESLVGGPFAGCGRYQYTCTETTLTANTPDAAPFSTSTFTRVTEFVPTPEPELPTEAPDPGPGDAGDLIPGDECQSLQVANFSTAGNSAVWEIVNGTAAPAEIVAVSSD